jgi:uncharacterized protein involved in outer membrane biogenesis
VTDAEPKLRPVNRFKPGYLGGSLALLATVVAALIFLWNWNWFRPLVEARAAAAIGRAVTLDRLDVALGRTTRVTAYGVKIANPPGFPTQTGIQASDFITIPRLDVFFQPVEWWRSGQLVLQSVDADQPTINIEQIGTGTGNWVAPERPTAPPSSLQVGDVGIQGGTAHIHIAREKSDVNATISTSHTADGDVVIVDGKGTHAGQPITFHGVGGAFVASRDSTKPYPIDFELANGPTRVTLKGHIRDPLALTGADLDLVLTGPDMALLLPLTGIATPSTPPYRISGRLSQIRQFHRQSRRQRPERRSGGRSARRAPDRDRNATLASGRPGGSRRLRRLDAGSRHHAWPDAEPGRPGGAGRGKPEAAANDADQCAESSRGRRPSYVSG